MASSFQDLKINLSLSGVLLTLLALSLIGCTEGKLPQTSEKFGDWEAFCHDGSATRGCQTTFYGESGTWLSVLFLAEAIEPVIMYSLGRTAKQEDKIFIEVEGQRTRLYYAIFNFSHSQETRIPNRLASEGPFITPADKQNIQSVLRALWQGKEVYAIANGSRQKISTNGFRESLVAADDGAAQFSINKASLSGGKISLTEENPIELTEPDAAKPNQQTSVPDRPKSNAGCSFAELDAEANRVTAPAQQPGPTPSATFKKLWLIMQDLRALHVQQNRRCPGVLQIDQVLAFDDQRISDLKRQGVAAGWLTSDGRLTF